MNEIKTNNFDYSVLDSSTAEYLKDRENSMSKTLENAAEKLGEDLYKAQQKLANNKSGVFEEWYTSLGFKRDKVYDFINKHKYIIGISDNISHLETFQQLGSSLQSEMSKPSANPEVNKAVFDGDVKTHKEYKELEHQLKQQEQQNATLQQQLDEVESRKPETVVKEVIPAHVKAQLSDKENELIENRRRTALLEKELNDMKNQSERKMDKSQEKLSYDDEIGSRRFKAESSVLDLRDEINEFLKRNSINAFREGAIATSSQRTKDSLLEGIEELELFCKTMRSSLDGRLIIN